LGSFDFAKHIPKRIGDFHEIKFRDQVFFVGGGFFLENLKILGIKEPCVSLISPNTFLKEWTVFMK